MVRIRGIAERGISIYSYIPAGAFPTAQDKEELEHWLRLEAALQALLQLNFKPLDLPDFQTG
jgi:hypothetical protein